MILETADTKGPVDGALLHLHGAMVTEAHEDAEGELLARWGLWDLEARTGS
jgi:microcystin degradation protein MlrC